MKRITIKDIARQTNFSKSTVSRVLMNDPNVKPETRERIQEALRTSNYQTNALARAMRSPWSLPEKKFPILRSFCSMI